MRLGNDQAQLVDIELRGALDAAVREIDDAGQDDLDVVARAAKLRDRSAQFIPAGDVVANKRSVAFRPLERWAWRTEFDGRFFARG